MVATPHLGASTNEAQEKAGTQVARSVRLALAGVAPVPWALSSADALEQATPLPGTAYKLDIARALIRRAVEAVAAPAGG